MSVKRAHFGTVHVIARCRGCSEEWESHKMAETAARRHAEKTGHEVRVAREQAWVYKRVD